MKRREILLRVASNEGQADTYPSSFNPVIRLNLLITNILLYLRLIYFIISFNKYILIIAQAASDYLQKKEYFNNMRSI